MSTLDTFPLTPLINVSPPVHDVSKENCNCSLCYTAAVGMADDGPHLETVGEHTTASKEVRTSPPLPTGDGGQTSGGPALPSSPPQAPSGWGAVEKALTEFDNQEVGAYKEDIDTLLVFAGLYSAVLTAFVIVSYTQLQEDTATETLQVLRIIANQTALGGQLSDSVRHVTSASSPFQPSDTAIRINVLWFASLIISLSSASLAIFVKQWLRAYMAFASASPQGQLRVRQFRRGGLEDWKVFEIASSLPLLLQISLALFFVGLCYFTIDIHPAIGHTTLPLVCAWAFLLITVTISPAFSSRCPYKTPALAAVTTMLRTRARLGSIVYLLKTLHLAFIPMITTRVPLLYSLLADAMRKRQLEEGDLINNDSEDWEILASADAFQVDNRLLQTTIVSALEQSDPSWFNAVKFLVRILSNRIPILESNSLYPYDGVPMIDVRPISRGVKEVVAKILELHVLAKFPVTKGELNVTRRPDYHIEAQWAVCVAASIYEPGMQLPVHVLSGVVESWFSGEDVNRLSDAQLFVNVQPVLSMVCVRLLMLQGTGRAFWVQLPESLQIGPTLRLGRLLEVVKSQRKKNRLSVPVRRLVEDTIRRLIQKVESTTVDPSDHAEIEAFHIGMAFMLQLFDCTPSYELAQDPQWYKSPGTRAGLRQLMLCRLKGSMQAALVSFLRVPNKSFGAFAEFIFTNPDDGAFISSEIPYVLAEYRESLDVAQLMDLAHLTLCLVQEGLERGFLHNQVKQWRIAFHSLANAITSQSLKLSRKSAMGRIVSDALETWSFIEEISRTRQGLQNFDETNAVIPDYFCLAYGECSEWVQLDGSPRAVYLNALSKGDQHRIKLQGRRELNEMERSIC